MAIWSPIEREELGWLHGLSQDVLRIENKRPGIIPDFSECETIVALSDYSGEQKSSLYKSISILFSSFDSVMGWSSVNDKFIYYFLRGRGISYKKLNDNRKFRALPHFLDIADCLNGLLLNILIDKSITNLYDIKKNEFEDIINKLDCSWNNKAFEKMLRILVFLFLFINGMSVDGQNVWWISDDDDIMPSEDHMVDMKKVIYHVSSVILEHQMGNIRWCRDSQVVNGMSFRYLMSIPDLSSGALCDMLTAYKKGRYQLCEHIMTPPPNIMRYKSKIICSWLAEQSNNLKKLNVVIEPSDLGIKRRWIWNHIV